MFTQFLQHPIWSYEFWGNTVQDYLIAVIVFLALLLIFGLFRHFALKRLEKLARTTKTDIDDTLIRIIKTLRPPFYSFVAFYLAFNTLTIGSLLFKKVVNVILLIWVVYQVIIALQVLIDYAFQKSVAEKKEADKVAIRLVNKIVKWLLWIFGVLFLLSNFGINVTSLIAGLGIGGIAIALAVQNILGDLLSSFAIYFDKPFEVGDFITVGESAGTVEKIGIKTTRIRSTTGEELIISNKELTTARVKNFKRLTERRIIFAIGVVYETPVKKLEKIPGIIQKIIEAEPNTRFDRVHFKNFADSALEFEVSYYARTTDYKEFMDVRQKVNLDILKEFEKEKISMAYPTQTLYLHKP